MEESRNLEGHTVGVLELLEHGPAHYQGIGGREFSWLSQLLELGPDPEQGLGSGF